MSVQKEPCVSSEKALKALFNAYYLDSIEETWRKPDSVAKSQSGSRELLEKVPTCSSLATSALNASTSFQQSSGLSPLAL